MNTGMNVFLTSVPSWGLLQTISFKHKLTNYYMRTLLCCTHTNCNFRLFIDRSLYWIIFFIATSFCSMLENIVTQHEIIFSILDFLSLQIPDFVLKIDIFYEMFIKHNLKIFNNILYKFVCYFNKELYETFQLAL